MSVYQGATTPVTFYEKPSNLYDGWVVFEPASRHDWVVFVRCPPGYFSTRLLIATREKRTMIFTYAATGSTCTTQRYTADKTLLDVMEDLIKEVDLELGHNQQGCQIRLMIKGELLDEKDYKHTLSFYFKEPPARLQAENVLNENQLLDKNQVLHENQPGPLEDGAQKEAAGVKKGPSGVRKKLPKKSVAAGASSKGGLKRPAKK